MLINFFLTVVGGVFMVEHLNIYKIIIEKIAKYLLLPGIELDINLNIRVSVKWCSAVLCGVLMSFFAASVL